MALSNSATLYGSVSKSLHWLTVLLIFTVPPYLYLAQRRVYGGGRLANLARTGTAAATAVR